MKVLLIIAPYFWVTTRIITIVIITTLILLLWQSLILSHMSSNSLISPFLSYNTISYDKQGTQSNLCWIIGHCNPVHTIWQPIKHKSRYYLYNVNVYPNIPKPSNQSFILPTIFFKPLNNSSIIFIYPDLPTLASQWLVSVIAKITI